MRKETGLIRIRILFIGLFLFLLTVSFAMAEGGIINPNQAQIWELERQANLLRRGSDTNGETGVYDGTVEAITFTEIITPTLGGKGTWSISYNTQYYGTPIKAKVRLAMKDYSSNYTTVYSMDYDYFPSSVSSCTIVSGGEYEFSVWVQSTTSGSGSYAGFVYFTVADDSAHTSLTEKVASVVASCRADTQWQTALNLHDWITSHVYYDTTYHYYGADMILRGYGVCDGYAKAYYMMCKKAGIPVYRITNSDHAWNALQLDGKWYYIDSTWDDPAGATTAVSGSEHHDYFCLNTALLELDHPRPWEWTNATEKKLTALDNNYYIRRNDWQGIGNRYYDNNAYRWTTYSEAIANQISANRGGNYISFQQFYFITDNRGYNVTYPLRSEVVRGWTLLAYAMGRQPMNIPGFGNTNIEVRFSESDRCFLYAIKGFSIQETGTLKLPSRITAITEEAFMNTNASAVVIPKGCVAIGRNAFKGSNIHRITIPDSVTSIDATAFSGCSPLLILCPANSEAMKFAQNNGILWHYSQ